MTKKILGIALASVFIGAPLFVSANPCVPGDPDYIGIDCSTPAMSNAPGSLPGSTTNAPGSLPGSTINTPTAGQGTGFGTDPNAPKLQNPIKFNNFSELAAQITKTAVEILLPFVVLAFIWSGFLFVRAQGNQTELENAKKNIWWSIVGALILMGAWGFATMISQTVQTLTN